MPTITIDRPTETEVPPLGIPLEDPADSTWGEDQGFREYEPEWVILLHNDDINTMEWVIVVLQKVFGYSIEKSILLMMEAHFDERSLVWTGSLEIAELHAERIVACGPDPSRLDTGAGPLRVSVERVS
jgi:ATP-dependent Clp protease adaptor protein ClpS